MKGKRLGWLLLGVLPLMVGVATTPSTAGIVVGQVSDDSKDDGKGDGTHDTQLNPSSSFWSGDIGFAGYDRPSGGQQVVGTSYTVDGGETWIDNGNINGGSNVLEGRVATGWNDKDDKYVIATENTFTGSGQRPIAVSDSNTWGLTWRGFTDTDINIGFGKVALFPDIEIHPDPASPYFGYIFLVYVLGDTGGTGQGDLYFTWSPSNGQNWISPVKVNETGCTVGHGDVAVAGSAVYAAYTCEEATTYTPEVRVSTNWGATWSAADLGLPEDLSYSGETNSCNSGSLVERTVGEDLGVFDFPRITYDPMGDMLFLTTTDHGEGTDLSDIHVFGAVETSNPTWVPYAGLPGDVGATWVAPELAVNYSKGTRNLWYTGALIPSSGLEYKMTTYVTTDLTNWNEHSFSPTYTLPVLKPNEDTAVPDCYYGHNLFDLDDLGDGKAGLTFVGQANGARRPSGGTGVDPDILFVALDPPVPDEEPTPTSMTMTIKKTDAKIKASGGISPVVAGFGEVEFSLFKKKDGTFQMVGSPKTTTFDAGAYKVSFNRPKKGSCRVTGEYPGNEDYEATSVTKTFSCKKG